MRGHRLYCGGNVTKRSIFSLQFLNRPFTIHVETRAQVQIQIGEPVNISWTAAFFPITGQYNVYHTYKVNKTIFQLQNEGILYGGHNVSNKYRYITRPYNSVNISFEIRHTTVDDAGYYAGGPTADSAWSGGGVVLIVSDGPEKVNITPKPSLNKYDQIEVRGGGFVGPFNCSADCNPACNITWQMKHSTRFYDVLSETGTLFQQVGIYMEMFCCVAKWTAIIK
uniref:Ig-like domain-containing protein n=1 Tax=Magallana gigas TaxID=29159 RepID=K1QHH4_MAGGI